MADPHVCRLEYGGIAQFNDGVVKFAMLNVIPSQQTVREFVSIGQGRMLVLVGHSFGVSRFRSSRGGEERLQCGNARLSAFGDANLDSGVQGPSVGFREEL